MDCVEDVARSRGYQALPFYTNVKMVENLGVYERMWVCETGRKYEDEVDRVYLRKDISAVLCFFRGRLGEVRGIKRILLRYLKILVCKSQYTCE